MPRPTHPCPTCEKPLTFRDDYTCFCDVCKINYAIGGNQWPNINTELRIVELRELDDSVPTVRSVW